MRCSKKHDGNSTRQHGACKGWQALISHARCQIMGIIPHSGQHGVASTVIDHTTQARSWNKIERTDNAP
eukprot:1159666-Pelagomonas_calceolata.AAC.5